MYKLINKVKEVNPLVLHYTNEVTINDCANATLALGGSPLMSYSYEEVEEIVSIASSVIINIGTMNSSRLNLFIEAGKAANKYNKPVILDPVGVFATKTRADFINKLLNKVRFDVIKGNVAEIKYIGGFDVRGQGVDSFDDGEDISEIIKRVAKKLDCIVVATGKIDTITDGKKVIKINNGTTKLKSVTGTGCMTASLIGSYIGASENKLNAAAMGVLTMSLSGELADKEDMSIGTFKVNLMDNIFNMSEEKLRKYGKVE
ncbi:hydroxyethylthiazole kinase [Clostridium gasigenes]|uniref:hydroxyethylthiazole kinase n=1 Tax=Clostridium gasigenes TaxID=94869 RepID=UPI0014384314|nr:hydroxyethylthiazole kinase [Clostridium gasigenes]NKF05496.1 hydroxyethylthiazole kinase [Clostridium gasigenes]QSW18941.1 hydroxyethylthiazole kinase [Clostridium gasigenes]